jgi:pyroglutamyl-peptidase
MVDAIRAERLPASVSDTAGTFVCNNLMYGVLDYLAAELPGTVGGFMHVPFAPEQTAKQALPAPSMSIADITRGIEAALRAIIEHLS